MKISQREKILIILTSMMVIIFLSYRIIKINKMFDYFEINKKISYLENKNKSTLKTINEKREIEQREKVEIEKRKILDIFFYGGDEKYSVVSFLEDINKIREELGVPYIEQNITESSYDENIIKMEIEMKFAGEYAELVKFAEKIENNKKMRITRFEIINDESSKKVNATIRVAAFFIKNGGGIN